VKYKHFSGSYETYRFFVWRWNVIGVMNEISEIVRACNTVNAKGIRRIRLIEWDSVDLKPFTRFSPTISNIPLKASKTWKNIAFSKKTGSYDEDKKTDRNYSDYYEQSLKFTIYGDSSPLTAFSWLTANKHFAALVTDENGITKFVPKLYSSSRLTKSERQNGYEYSLQNRSRYPARIVDNSADGSGGSGGSGTILKASMGLWLNAPLGNQRLERADSGDFNADGIVSDPHPCRIFMPSINATFLSTLSIFNPTVLLWEGPAFLPVANGNLPVVISEDTASPRYENFQYGTI